MTFFLIFSEEYVWYNDDNMEIDKIQKVTVFVGGHGITLPLSELRLYLRLVNVDLLPDNKEETIIKEYYGQSATCRRSTH